MDAKTFYETNLVPGVRFFVAIAPKVPITRAVEVELLAIAGQEGNWEFRVQNDDGPAHSFFQMERNGGVAGVLEHPAAGPYADRLCDAIPVVPQAMPVWKLFATPAGDALAVSFARLLLWTDPSPIPTDEESGWQTYLRNWRPGKPSRERWSDVYPQADAAVPQETVA